MVIKINFIRMFLYGLLGTLLSVSGIGFFTHTLTFCLVFAIIFLIEGDELRFKIAGTNNPWPLQLLTERTILSDNRISDVTAAILATRELTADSEFIVRAQATGDGSGNLIDSSFDIGQYQGQLGIIYIYDNSEAGYVYFDDLKQYEFGTQIDIKY